jgi:hypothetical protein
MSTFLTAEDMAALTGYKTKARQIESLRTMGIAFWVNPAGRAVVARSVIEGRGTAAVIPKAAWIPPGMRK